MIESKLTWIVIPAYNEAKVILSVVEPLLTCGYQVVVVDDCSTDSTRAEIKKTKAHLLSHPINLGQGAALQTGISYALMENADYIVTFDGDGQHLVSEIPKLLKPLMDGQCDVTLGNRFMPGGSALNIPRSKRYLLRVATIFTRCLTRLDVSDTHNGFRAFNANAAKIISITQNRMAHATQILSEIRKHRLRYREVAVQIIYTKYSIKKGQRISGAFNIIWESLMEFLGL